MLDAFRAVSEQHCLSAPWEASLLRPSPASPNTHLGEQLIPKQWRNFGTLAEVSGLKGGSTPTLLWAEGVMGVPQPAVQSWEVPCFPFPPPPSCCSLTQAGAERERHLQLHCCLLAPEPLPESKSFSKKSLNSFNRQLELLPHRSKGHELSVFIALGRFMSLFFKGGREGRLWHIT